MWLMVTVAPASFELVDLCMKQGNVPVWYNECLLAKDVPSTMYPGPRTQDPDPCAWMGLQTSVKTPILGTVPHRNATTAPHSHTSHH